MASTRKLPSTLSNKTWFADVAPPRIAFDVRSARFKDRGADESAWRGNWLSLRKQAEKGRERETN
jgi:hypothetical protein